MPLVQVNINEINTDPKIVIVKDYYGEEIEVHTHRLSPDCLVLGMEKCPQIMCRDAVRLGIRETFNDERDNGWCDYPVPEEVLLYQRISLDVKGAKKMIELLQKFLELH
jgi:hypothetical protein